MPTFEELTRAGAVPYQEPGMASPAPGPGQGLSFEQLSAMGATPFDTAQAPVPVAGPAPVQQDVSRGAAIGRGIFQGVTLGFGDEITGAVRSLFGPNSYQQERDAARQANVQNKEAHPWLYGGGELAGGIGTVFIPGLNVAKGATVAKAAAAAARGGALQALGETEADLTQGNFAGAIQDSVRGAVTGAAVGGALHGIGQRIAKGAEKRFEGDIVADAMNRSRGKDYLQVQKIMESDPGAAKAVLHSEDFKPVQKALRSGNTEKARDQIEGYITKVSNNREQDWKALDKLLPEAGESVGKVINRFEHDIQRAGLQHGESDIAKVLTTVKDRLQSTWSTIDKTKAVQDLEKAGLSDLATAVSKHEGKALFGKDLFKIAEDVTKDADGLVPKPVRDALAGLEMKYNPDARVSGLELRHALTKSQDEAVSALGTIAETEHARLKAAPKAVFDAIMDQFLDKAKLHSPQAEALASKILDRNKKLSIALSFQEGLEQKAKKELVGSKGLTSSMQGAAGTMLKGLGIGSLLSGNFGTAAAELAAPYALKAAGAGARRGNDTLARIIYSAEQGNPWAIKQLAALRNTPQGLARIAAAKKPGGTDQEQGQSQEPMPIQTGVGL